MDAQLNSNFLPLSNAVLEQNILILNTGSKLVLFDTGMGALKLFGRPPASCSPRCARPASTPTTSTPW